MYNFLERVESVRKGLSTSAFARALGMGQKTVDFYLKGERKPSVEFVTNICSKFGVSADWLLGLPERGGSAAVDAPNNSGAIAVGSNALATAGGDCSKCQLMQAHIREITGRG